MGETIVARVGGLIVVALGVLVGWAGGGLAMALLGRTLPDVPLLRDLSPYIAKVAEGAALPAGSDWGALTASPVGVIALAALGAGMLIALAGVSQVVTGRGGGVTLVLVVAAVCGFAVAAALA
jgi:hypothetical protein